ncbi:MAG: type II secretion system protein [Nitrospira sp.]
MKINYLSKAFTLIEILTSVAILTVIMSVVIFNYSKFNNNIALSSAGQEITVAVRQAQVYGLSVKETSTGSGQFNTAYGIHFQPSDPTNYYVFADKNGNSVYDVGGGCGSVNTECIEKFSLKNGVKIFDICNESSCSPLPGQNKLNILFKRPETNAIIYFGNNFGVNSSGPYQTGKIILISPNSKESTITVESTGYILTQ